MLMYEGTREILFPKNNQVLNQVPLENDALGTNSTFLDLSSYITGHRDGHGKEESFGTDQLTESEYQKTMVVGGTWGLRSSVCV